jgi:ADP-ribosylglycohydrolase
MDTKTLESRIKGSLWGLPVGDAMGAPYEVLDFSSSYGQQSIPRN